MFSSIAGNNQSLFNIPQNNIPQQNNNKEEENKLIAMKINNDINSIDVKNPQGLVKQSVKNALGLNFKNFNNSYARNVQISDPSKTYFLTHNLRTNLEKDKKDQLNTYEFLSKYNAQKFEQISNQFLSKEKDYYQQFIELNGKIGIDNLNNINNITSELRKINANSAYNYMQENPDFDFNNNKMGIYLLLQQNGNSGKIFDNKKNKLPTSFKRCNEHQRRKEIRKKEKKNEKNQKVLKAFNNVIDTKSSMNKIDSKSNLSMGKSSNIKDNRTSKINIANQKQSYLIEEESNLFEKYFNSFIPYFKELISNKKININDKILKLREVLDTNINNFREGRKNFCQFLKRLITPLNIKDNSDKLTTKNLVGRVIKFLEDDFFQRNYISSQSQAFKNKEDFITNYTNNIIYTYFSNVTSYSQSKTIILWAKIFFYIRFGWKRQCIEFINQIAGIYINESGLNEIKESLDDSKEISLQNYNEFKRIINQERKEENPFKHACMVYMTKIPETLYNNILLEINDHLWFNLNLIYPQENYKNLIINEKDNNNENNILEIDTSSNQNDNNRIIELIKLKDLQLFFENISIQELINSNNKNTNFVYIILMIGLLKFKKALSFMIKNNMYVDAINFYFILQQLGIYSDFDEINDKEIIIKSKKKQVENINEKEEIYQVYPRVSDNIPALMIYCIYSCINFIQPLSYLLIETEEFEVLNNYHKKMLLFPNNIKDQINNGFNVCLKDMIDENTLRKLCKNIFNLLLKHEMRNNASLNPLFKIFKDLKMLTELTGILINKSIELLNLKRPIIRYENNGEISIVLSDNKNQRFFGYSLIINYFGALINDVSQLYIEKQNDLEKLMDNNIDNRNNEKIFLIQREIEENNLPISLLKQLPIIENIYERIFEGNLTEAFRLFLENISIVQIGFQNEEKDYISIFNNFINEQLKKLKYGLLGLYPEVLYLFVWVFKNELSEIHKKGYNSILATMKDNSKALEYLLDRLVEMSDNDRDLMGYSTYFIKARDEVNQIQQFYQQNNYIF